MCGIVGGVGKRNLVPDLIEALKKLEYRGYDSAGLAGLDKNNKINISKAVGKIAALEKTLTVNPIQTNIGIAHTRWATHGKPCIENTHPLKIGHWVAVHNGIFENHQSIKNELPDIKYESETDTEVFVHQLHQLSAYHDPLSALYKSCQKLKGDYAVGAIFEKTPNTIYATRFHSPLIIGLGDDENYIASDMHALLHLTNRFIILQDGDTVALTAHDIHLFDVDFNTIERPIHVSNRSVHSMDKMAYKHYMHKEIHEQPNVCRKMLQQYISNDKILIPQLLDDIQNIHIIACGTSYYAGLLASRWMEQYLKIPAKASIASEWNTEYPFVQDNTLCIFISQSGETADTLAALRIIKQKKIDNVKTLAICNTPESSLTRMCGHALETHAGIEIGVASTKAFTAQLLVLYLFLLRHCNEAKRSKGLKDLSTTPYAYEKALHLEEDIKKLAERIMKKEHILFLGKNATFPIALEGALKMKEISYIHAEAYPSGELKHGPLALIDENMPVVIIVPKNRETANKVLNSAREVQSRRAEVFMLSQSIPEGEATQTHHILLDVDINEDIFSIVSVIPLQLLAYHTALLKGTDIDQPRNLAKSVTVE